MRINVNLIERAVIFAAQIVRTLTDRTVDIRILSVIHGKGSFPPRLFCRAGLCCPDFARLCIRYEIYRRYAGFIIIPSNCRLH